MLAVQAIYKHGRGDTIKPCFSDINVDRRQKCRGQKELNEVKINSTYRKRSINVLRWTFINWVFNRVLHATVVRD